MVKQLNYVWLTAEITVQKLQNTSSTLKGQCSHIVYFTKPFKLITSRRYQRNLSACFIMQAHGHMHNQNG